MLVKQKYIILTLLLLPLVLLSGCGEADILRNELSQSEPEPVVLSGEENRVFGEIGETVAQLTGVIGIEGLGEFEFNPDEVVSLRDDIFREGYFSLFDILVHLAKTAK